ncbi:MAG: 3-deoxy-D-manno-octulosonic acid transferase [Planctomycetes bacterium]|nr:3-deoxy-D-manno-octulosonic acid transferase [Planctomycetota bacterium]
MRFLLDLIYLLAAPFILAALFLKSRLFTGKRYFAGLKRRLAVPAPRRVSERPCLWVHAVSVGEVRTALPLLAALAEAFPEWDLALSTSTETGFEAAAKSALPAAPALQLFYMPLDLSWLVRRALRAVRSKAVVLVELELWPNFLLAARDLGIPVFVANGRLTERSARRYRSAGFLGRLLFSLPAGYAAQNQAYAGRFASLGVPADRLRILGNLKYDVRSKTFLPRETLGRLGWGGGEAGPILMGGCTHPGEEAALIELIRDLEPRLPGLKGILAPRHIERAGEVLEACQRSGLGLARRWSELAGAPPPASSGAVPAPRFLVVDQIGELDRFYQIAGIAFVGGSLIPYGGHNLLEPARFGKPVLFGPFIFNFADLAQHFLERRAAVQVEGKERLRQEVEHLLSSPAEREDLGRRAAQAAGELQGAVERHVEWLREKLR